MSEFDGLDYAEFVGTVSLFAKGIDLRTWMPCDGRMLVKDKYVVLWSLIRNAYGNDSEKSFALPDLRGKEPAEELQYYICVLGEFPERSR